ncbi:hypothetical protein [Priestia megaterium]|uniref:hypothetical protein n=1 Tax=Priestia megaterium TaxID=1404 RepID=UPI0035B5AE36
MYKERLVVKQVFNEIMLKKVGETSFDFQFYTEDGKAINLSASNVYVDLKSDNGSIQRKQAIVKEKHNVSISMNFNDFKESKNIQIDFILNHPKDVIEKVTSGKYQQITLIPKFNNSKEFITVYITVKNFSGEFKDDTNVLKKIGPNNIQDKERESNKITNTSSNSLDTSKENASKNPEIYTQDKLSNLNLLFEKTGKMVSILEFQDSSQVDDTKMFVEAITYCEKIAQSKGIEVVPTIIVPAAKQFVVSNTLRKALYVKMLSIGLVNILYTGQGAFMHHLNNKEVVDFKKKLGYSQMPFNTGEVFSAVLGKFLIKGLGKASAQKQIGFRIGEEVIQSLHNTHTAWSSFKDVYFEGFYQGISFTQKQTYIMDFNNIVMNACGICITDEGNSQNSGEMITWRKCAFHNSDLILEVNGEINHAFSVSHFDYCNSAVKINGNHYQRQVFDTTWFEGSNVPGKTPLIQADLNSTANSNHIVIKNSKIYPRDRVPDTLIRGPLTLSIKDNTIEGNRYSSQNLASGAVLCDDNVIIAGDSGNMFHDNAIVISRQAALNQNSSFEANLVGEKSIIGFKINSGIGSASGEITDIQKYSGTKSIRIIGGSGSYFDFETDVFPLQMAAKVYGQARIYLNRNYCKATITTYLIFYGCDQKTVIDQYSLVQNMDYRNKYEENRWFALLSGTSSQPYKIPPTSVYCKFRIVIGDIQSFDVYIDDMMLTRI